MSSNAEPILILSIFMQPRILSLITATEIAELRHSCHPWLSGHRPALSMRKALEEMAALREAGLALDVLGAGTFIHRLVADVESRLGKSAALFMPQGIAAQLASLRGWVGPSASAWIAVHPQSHMVVDEDHAHVLLAGLRTTHLGTLDEPFGVDDQLAMQERPDAVVVKLPLRRGGFRLPPWNELKAISSWCQQHRIPLHVDGAPLW